MRRDWIEQRIAELTRDCILQDDVIEWIADNAVEFQMQARRTVEVTIMEDSLAEAKKAAKNIMAAIEQGIITPTTKSRLLELEEQIAELERSLAVARRTNEPIDKERIIYALEKLRGGDVTNKSYQAKLINTFVKMVYLWDDKIRIDYYYAGKRNSITYTMTTEDSEDLALDECPEGFVFTRVASTKQKSGPHSGPDFSLSKSTNLGTRPDECSDIVLTYYLPVDIL